MTKDSPARSRAKDPTEDRLARLEEENRQLRRDLDDLRAGLCAEVRTKRLVVETADGFERVVAQSDPAYGGIEVHARPAPGRGATYAALYGSDENMAPAASVFLLGDGNGCGSFDVAGAWGDREARCSLSIDGPAGAAVVIDSEGFKNAPMRLYLEREAAKNERRAS